MDLQNLWIGIGIQVGGSLGFGVDYTEGVLFNAVELWSLPKAPTKSLRYAEVFQTTYSGMVGISFSGSQDPVFMLGRVNNNITELNRPFDYTKEWQLSVSFGFINKTIGHSIAQLGKIDRSVARVAGVSYSWANKIADIVVKMQSGADFLGMLNGPPPWLKIFPIPVSPWAFEFDVGRKVGLATTRVLSSGTLTR